jgi:hypothetical protein
MPQGATRFREALNNMAVIASAAKQSSVSIKLAFLDCRVAALLAMTN